MSILSKLFNKKFGVPEIKVDENPIAIALIDSILKKGYDVVFQPLTTADLQKLITIISIEIQRRNDANKS